MGAVASSTFSRLSRPFKKFNIEQRAEKVLSQEKPTPAPTYSSTELQLKMSQELDPNFVEKQKKRDSDLHERLKQIFVSSNTIQTDKQETEDDKLKPKRRTTDPEFAYGFWEPTEIPEGRCTLGQAMKFMADNMSDSKKNSVQDIALKYKLNGQDVENILEYYRVFQVIIPKSAPQYTYVPINKDKAEAKISDK